MRSYPIPSIIFFCATLILGACQDGDNTSTALTPPLSASPARLQFERIVFGQRATGTWTLKNVTEKDVVIRRIGPFSCQCVSAKLRLPARGQELATLRGEIMNLALHPNETAEIVFTLDTARYRKPVSRKLGSIPIVFADHPGMILEWAADVYTPFVVSPWAIEMGNVGIRQQATGRAMVAAHDSNEFILDVDGVFNGWFVKSNAVVLDGHQRSAYELIFTAPSELAEGPFSQIFQFKTNLPDAPPVKINVQGVARPDVYVQPQRLVFDLSRGKTVQEFAVLQTAIDHKAPILDLNQFAEAGFSLEYLSNSTDKVSLYKIEYVATPAAIDGANGTLNIQTNYELQPAIELSFTVLPSR